MLRTIQGKKHRGGPLPFSVGIFLGIAVDQMLPHISTNLKNTITITPISFEAKGRALNAFYILIKWVLICLVINTTQRHKIPVIPVTCGRVIHL